MSTSGIAGPLAASRYLHFIESDDCGYLFNSLTLEALEATGEQRDELRRWWGDRSEDQLSPDMRSFLVEHRALVAEGSERPGDALRHLNRLRDEASTRPARIGFARISLTERCNMGCSYCFQQELFAQYQPSMTPEVLERTLSELVTQNEGKGLVLQYFGGEPMLKFSMIEQGNALVQKALREGRIARLHQTITTNGTLFTDEAARFFVDNDFSIVFSLDGWREVNDEFRVLKNGMGTYDMVLGAIKRYRSAGGRVSILLTSSAESVERLPEVVRFLIEDPDIGATEVGVNAPQPREGGWDVGGERLAMAIQESWKICAEAGVTFYGPGTFIPEVLRTRRPQIDRCIESEPFADSGDWPAYIAADGTLSYCVVHHQDERCVDPSLDEVDEDRLRAWHYDTSVQDACDDCIASQVCGGPCSLELMLWGGELSADRCGFFQEMVRWAVTQ